MKGKSRMTQQKAQYPLDYAKGPSERGAGDRLREMADTAGDQLKDAAERAQHVAGDVAQQAREYGEKAQAAARQFKPMVEKSLKEQPMATLAAAAVIGFVFGALWKK
jgi:ElaB/YqjD/DUF883 family membrane-anchored ribosome-binding protein